MQIRKNDDLLGLASIRVIGRLDECRHRVVGGSVDKPMRLEQNDRRQGLVAEWLLHARRLTRASCYRQGLADLSGSSCTWVEYSCSSGCSMSVGGLVDETEVCPAVYAEDLDPAAVTALLGCSPTSSHLRGERRSPRSPLQKGGGWFLNVRGRAPEDPEELSLRLLDRLPRDESTWIKLGELHEVQLRFAIHKTGWNRGFDFSPATVDRVALLHARLVFDIYANDQLTEVDEELDEISARCDAASPSPWRSLVEGRDHTSGSSFIMRGEGTSRHKDIELTWATVEDQDFIAHARQDVPRLVAEVARLRRMLKERSDS